MIAKHGGSAAKNKKLRNIKVKAQVRPNGMEVLHSRSVNQLFTSVRDDVKPFIDEFMVAEFFKQTKKGGVE